MPLWDKSGKRPTWLNQTQKRNVVATDSGWIRKVNKGSTSKEEILVAIGELGDSESMGSPSVSELYVANTTGGSTIGVDQTGYLYAVYDEPVTFADGSPQATITLANTISGVSGIVAIMNDDKSTIINANNTVRYEFVANTAGTYKIEAQTIANSANVYSLNVSNETADMTISAEVSNSLSTFIVV